MSDEISHDEKEAPASGPENQLQKRVSRRGLFRAGAATSLGAAGAYAATLPGLHSDADAAPAPAAVIPITEVHQMAAMPGQTNELAGYTFFNPLMVDVISAAADRIIPKDDNGPSGTEAGVVYFIDRQLSSEYGMVGKRYNAGPFTSGTVNQGDQSGTSMRDRYRRGVDGIQAYSQQTFQQDFKALNPDQQDQILRDLEAGKATGYPASGGQTFFTLLVNHVKAGFFADPIYGGNRDMAGWQLIGYPGAQIVYQDWISRYGEKFTGPFMSLADHQEALHQQPGSTTMTPAPSTGGAVATAAAVAPTAPVATAAAAAPAAMAGGTVVNVIEKDFSFALDMSSVPAGTVTFNCVNQGAAPHNIEFTSINKVSDTINGGQTTKFTVDFQPGSYPYICNIPGHAQLGMKGTFTVTAATAMTAASGAPAAAAGGGTMVNVLTKDYSFEFDKATIPAGMVTFNLSNQGMKPHNLALTSLNMTSMTVRPGQMVQFTVNLQPGMLPYICSIPGHADLGMKGTLTIQ